MNNFTFLDKDQVFGNYELDILKKYGVECAITDFSVLLGGEVVTTVYTSEGNSKKDCIGYWWTKSPDNDDDAYYIDDETTAGYVNDRRVGGRPALPYSSISKMCSNFKITQKGILEVEYGEYPQTIVSEDIAKELEELYINRIIKLTGKSYITDLFEVDSDNRDNPFKSRTHVEYEYNGRKYIRFICGFDHGSYTLANGVEIYEGDVYWVEVEPIKWMIDEKTDIALSKKILFAGVQFNYVSDYEGDFDNTDIKKYMDNYFSKDIIPTKTKELTEEEKKQREEELKKIEQRKIEEQKRRNPYGFNLEQVSEEEIIKGAIDSGIAVFLHGQSSEGKSARIKQIDPECVIIYLRNATPESLNGKSVYNSETGEMIDIKPTWLKKLEDKCEKEQDKMHIVFFDEITNALPSIQGIAFNIVLDREVNGIWKLPENARVVAAGNDMKDSLAANQLAEPLFNRFAHVYIKTTTESWLKWASENKIHPAIYAYIAYKKGEVLRSKYDGEKPNADPRKWEMSSKMLYSTGRPEMLRALVGEDITREFCQFCNQRVITLEDVLNDNYTEDDLQMNTSEIYATAMGLSQVDEENFEKVRDFVSKLGGEPCAIFDSLWIRGDEKRMEIVAESRLENSIGNKKNTLLK